MFSISVVTALSLTAASTLAAPTVLSIGCDLFGVNVDIPAGQSVLTTNFGFPVSFLGLAVGTQNYTCSNSGTFTYVEPMFFLMTQYEIIDPIIQVHRRLSPDLRHLLHR
jgi:hypothetical protein